jgi:hypothetical protein
MTKGYFSAQGRSVEYNYFDFHSNCKKGNTSILDESIRNVFKKEYLRDIGVYSEKTVSYLEKGKM